MTTPPGVRTSPVRDRLPPSNNGPVKRGILAFVDRVTRQDLPAFVPVAERIATFDNDDGSWCEQPVPVQVLFALDRVKALASRYPEWRDREPFEPFTFSTTGAAVYQLGNFGTARKKLHGWPLNR